MAAQLITRDSEQVNYESGSVILPEMDQATVRHMANKIDYIYTAFPTNTTINYNKWYTMKLMVHNGVVEAFVNDGQIYVSAYAFPTGEYHEPHLAARYAVARFEYVRVYVISDRSISIRDNGTKRSQLDNAVDRSILPRPRKTWS